MWNANWPRPVINLVQSVHHAHPGHPLYAFLPNRATLTCHNLIFTPDPVSGSGEFDQPMSLRH